MGNHWGDWVSIEAAMERQQAEDVERRAVRERRRRLHVVTDEQTPAEPAEASEAVLARPEESLAQPEPPVDPAEAIRRHIWRKVDPVEGIRLYARYLRAKLEEHDR